LLTDVLTSEFDFEARDARRRRLCLFRTPRVVLPVSGLPSTSCTLALLFLPAGAALNVSGLYISLAESERELHDRALSHGWEIADKFAVFELMPPDAILEPEQHQSLLYSSDRAVVRWDHAESIVVLTFKYTEHVCSRHDSRRRKPDW
jgi:KaiC/GvpD/RAD55 family RecA-like ATPase